VWLEDLDAFSVGHSFERCLNDMLKSGDQTLLDSFVEEGHVIWVVLEHKLDAKLNVIFCTVHVVLKSSECQFWFNHPELAQMSWSVGVLGSESRSERVSISQTNCDSFDVKLSTHGQVSGSAKQIFFVIKLLLWEWDWFEVEQIFFFWSVTFLFLVLLWSLSFGWILCFLFFGSLQFCFFNLF
jgi:hypothetical protein